MKRSPLVRRAGLRRTGRLAPMSARRRRDLSTRAEVRQAVLARQGWRCAAEGMPDLGPCGFLPGRRQLEVDELSGGSARRAEWLDTDRCQALCPRHHDWKHAHPADAYRVGLAARTDHTPRVLP